MNQKKLLHLSIIIRLLFLPIFIFVSICLKFTVDLTVIISYLWIEARIDEFLAPREIVINQLAANSKF